MENSFGAMNGPGPAAGFLFGNRAIPARRGTNTHSGRECAREESEPMRVTGED